IAQNAGLFANTPDPNTPLIHGTVYMWRHQIAPNSTTDPFYGDYVYNYNPNDYIGYNSTGPNPPGFNGNIAAGQAFFVLMNDGATTPSNVTFNNAMRFGGSDPTNPIPFDNTEFYTTTQIDKSQGNRSAMEKHR